VVIALVVGTLLFCINQLDVVIRGDATTGVWVKTALTYVVPIVVSNLGVLTGTRRRADVPRVTRYEATALTQPTPRDRVVRAHVLHALSSAQRRQNLPTEDYPSSRYLSRGCRHLRNHPQDREASGDCHRTHSPGPIPQLRPGNCLGRRTGGKDQRADHRQDDVAERSTSDPPAGGVGAGRRGGHRLGPDRVFVGVLCSSGLEPVALLSGDLEELTAMQAA